VVVKQADGKDLDPGLITVQHRLSGRTRLAFDLLACRGVDRVDGAGRDRAAERCRNRAAHECLRLGDVIGEGERVLDPVLGRDLRSIRLPSPVSRKESLRAVSFWKNTPLDACCGTGFDPKVSRPRIFARVSSSRESSGGRPS